METTKLIEGFKKLSEEHPECINIGLTFITINYYSPSIGTLHFHLYYNTFWRILGGRIECKLTFNDNISLNISKETYQELYAYATVRRDLYYAKVKTNWINNSEKILNTYLK